LSRYQRAASNTRDQKNVSRSRNVLLMTVPVVVVGWRAESGPYYMEGSCCRQIASRSAGGSSQHRTGGPCRGPLVIIAKDIHLAEDDVLLFLQSLSLSAAALGPRLTLSIGQPSSYSLSEYKTDQGMCYNDWH